MISGKENYDIRQEGKETTEAKNNRIMKEQRKNGKRVEK